MNGINEINKEELGGISGGDIDLGRGPEIFPKTNPDYPYLPKSGENIQCPQCGSDKTMFLDMVDGKPKYICMKCKAEFIK